MRRLLGFWFSITPALGTLCCGGGLGSALDAFHEGRLPAAAAELRALEPTLGTASASDQARYALYRGLAELGLGNAPAAEHWLTSAWRADARDPRLFDSKEHGELLAAWRSLGHLPGEPGGARRDSQEGGKAGRI
jgi:hypothetical protein